MLAWHDSLAINLSDQGSRTCRARLEALDTSSLATLVRFQSAINYSQSMSLTTQNTIGGGLRARLVHPSHHSRCPQFRPTINSLLEAGNFDSRRVV